MFRPILDHPQFQNWSLKHNEEEIYIVSVETNPVITTLVYMTPRIYRQISYDIS
jgi:hypothetical protein